MRKCSTRLNPLKWKYYLCKRPRGSCNWTQTAGPRYRNYFPYSYEHTVFNRQKYLSYFPYLKAKGLFSCFSSVFSFSAVFTDLNGNVYFIKSRSRAGSISQTEIPDPVVSRPALCILLPSVFRSEPCVNLSVSCCLSIISVFY